MSREWGCSYATGEQMCLGETTKRAPEHEKGHRLHDDHQGHLSEGSQAAMTKLAVTARLPWFLGVS
jgi:hypothetical protein